MESWCEMLRVSTAERSICWSAASVNTNLPFWDTVQNDVTEWKSSAEIDFTCCNWVFAAVLHKCDAFLTEQWDCMVGKKLLPITAGDPEALVCCSAPVLQLCYKEAKPSVPGGWVCKEIPFWKIQVALWKCFTVCTLAKSSDNHLFVSHSFI